MWHIQEQKEEWELVTWIKRRVAFIKKHTTKTRKTRTRREWLCWLHVSLGVESAGGDVGLGHMVVVMVVRVLTDLLNLDNTVHGIYSLWAGEQLLTNRVSIILPLFPPPFGFLWSCRYEHILYSAHPRSPGCIYHLQAHLPTKRTNTKLFMALKAKRKNPRIRSRFGYVAGNGQYQARIATYIKTIFMTCWTWPIRGDCDKNLKVPLLQVTGKGSYDHRQGTIHNE